MPKLQHALKFWLQEGHTQSEFVEATGIDVGTTSLIFRGKRGLTLAQRAAIYHAFANTDDMQDALGWLVADLRDNIPPEVERFIEVQIKQQHGGAVRETAAGTPRRSKKDRAKAEFIALLESDDPAALDLVMSLYDFAHGRNQQS